MAQVKDIMKTFLTLLALSVTCCEADLSEIVQADTVNCTLAPSGVNDGPSLAATSAACPGGVDLTAGTYTVQLLPVSWGSLGSTIVSSLRGVEGKTVIKIVGGAAKRDMVGLYVPPGANNVTFSGIRFDGNGVDGLDVNEHSPLVQVRGPATGLVYERNVCDYPQLGARGDCLSSIGYGPDRFVAWHVHHNTFEHAARVGVAFHSGTRGEIDHNVFLDGGRAADIDGEGSGENMLHIHHNRIQRGPNTASVVGINIEADTGHEINDNVITGKVLNFYGCAGCNVHDNQVTLDYATSAPVLTVSKQSPNYTDHDNTYTRTAGWGFVVLVAQKISAPTDVLFEDAKITQAVNGAVAIQSSGIAGMAVRHSTITHTGTTPAIAWNAEAITSRTTGLVVDRSTFVGPFSSVLVVSDSNGGTGSVTVTASTALNAVKGIWCKSTALAAKVLGPIVSFDNTMPVPSCGGLWP